MHTVNVHWEGGSLVLWCDSHMLQRLKKDPRSMDDVFT